MDQETMRKLREHYDSVDTSADMENGVWETDVDPDPMVTTSLRLPKSLLDWLRERAAEERIKPTALVRRWIEEQREQSEGGGSASSGSSSIDARVARLENAVFGSTAGALPPPIRSAGWHAIPVVPVHPLFGPAKVADVDHLGVVRGLEASVGPPAWFGPGEPLLESCGLDAERMQAILGVNPSVVMWLAQPRSGEADLSGAPTPRSG